MENSMLMLSETATEISIHDLEIGKTYSRFSKEGQGEPIVLGELQSIKQCGYAFGGSLINGRKVPTYRAIFSNNGVLTKIIHF